MMTYLKSGLFQNIPNPNIREEWTRIERACVYVVGCKQTIARRESRVRRGGGRGGRWEVEGRGGKEREDMKKE